MEHILVALLILTELPFVYSDTGTELSINSDCAWNYTQKDVNGKQTYNVFSWQVNAVELNTNSSQIMSEDTGLQIEMLGDDVDAKRPLNITWETSFLSNTLLISFLDNVNEEANEETSVFNFQVSTIDTEIQIYNLQFLCYEIPKGVKGLIRICNMTKEDQNVTELFCTRKEIDTISCSCDEVHLYVSEDTTIQNGVIEILFTISNGMRISVDVVRVDENKTVYSLKQLEIHPNNKSLEIPDALESPGNYTIEVALFCQDFSSHSAAHECFSKSFVIVKTPTIDDASMDSNTSTVLLLSVGFGAWILFMVTMAVLRRRRIYRRKANQHVVRSLSRPEVLRCRRIYRRKANQHVVRSLSRPEGLDVLQTQITGSKSKLMDVMEGNYSVENETARSTLEKMSQKQVSTSHYVRSWHPRHIDPSINGICIHSKLYDVEKNDGHIYNPLCSGDRRLSIGRKLYDSTSTSYETTIPDTEKPKLQEEYCKESIKSTLTVQKVCIVKPVLTGDSALNGDVSTEPNTSNGIIEIYQNAAIKETDVDWNDFFSYLMRKLCTPRWKIFFIHLLGKTFPEEENVSGLISNIECRTRMKPGGDQLEVVVYDILEWWKNKTKSPTIQDIKQALEESDHLEIINDLRNRSFKHRFSPEETSTEKVKRIPALEYRIKPRETDLQALPFFNNMQDVSFPGSSKDMNRYYYCINHDAPIKQQHRSKRKHGTVNYSKVNLTRNDRMCSELILEVVQTNPERKLRSGEFALLLKLIIYRIQVASSREICLSQLLQTELAEYLSCEHIQSSESGKLHILKTGEQKLVLFDDIWKLIETYVERARNVAVEHNKDSEKKYLFLTHDGYKVTSYYLGIRKTSFKESSGEDSSTDNGSFKKRKTDSYPKLKRKNLKVSRNTEAIRHPCSAESSGEELFGNGRRSRKKLRKVFSTRVKRQKFKISRVFTENRSDSTSSETSSEIDSDTSESIKKQRKSKHNKSKRRFIQVKESKEENHSSTEESTDQSDVSVKTSRKRDLRLRNRKLKRLQSKDSPFKSKRGTTKGLFQTSNLTAMDIDMLAEVIIKRQSGTTNAVAVENLHPVEEPINRVSIQSTSHEKGGGIESDHFFKVTEC